ncbi:unnamed protein product, partial [Brassica oleracea]
RQNLSLRQIASLGFVPFCSTTREPVTQNIIIICLLNV